jgi:hypothetical protein
MNAPNRAGYGTQKIEVLRALTFYKYFTFLQCCGFGCGSGQIQSRSDPEPVVSGTFGLVGSGIVVPDPDLTFLTRKPVNIVQICSSNWSNSSSVTFIFLRKSLKFIKGITTVPLCTVCQLFSWPGLKSRIRTKLFRIHKTALFLRSCCFT